MKRWWLAAALVAAGCGSDKDDEGGVQDAALQGASDAASPDAGADAAAPPPPAFAAPQAVAWAGDRLLVTSTAFDGATLSYGDGFVSVIDPVAGRVVNRIPTTQKDPQALVVHGDSVFVVNSGVLDYTDFEHPLGQEPGGIDRLAIATLDSATAPTSSLEIPIPADAKDVAGPTDLAFVGEHGLVTLSIADAALLYDASTNTLVRGPADPIRYDGGTDRHVALGSVAADDAKFYLLDFNADRLFVLDASGQPWPCSVDLGALPDMLEGAEFPRLEGGKLFYLLGVAGAVRALDLTALMPDCSGAAPADVVGALGQIPNDLDAAGGRLYVVHSGDNNVKAYDAMSGAEVQSWALDAGANPWNAAISPDGRWLAVSEWKANAVTLFDLQGGQTVRITQ